MSDREDRKIGQSVQERIVFHGGDLWRAAAASIMEAEMAAEEYEALGHLRASGERRVESGKEALHRAKVRAELIRRLDSPEALRFEALHFARVRAERLDSPGFRR